MDKYLIQILKEVNTIIIPDFGALTIVDESSNDIMFMPYMKYDDGKLAEHIAKKESWELNEAKNLIAKYVREVTTTLDKGESYDIYQFGGFSKNADGEVEFKSHKSKDGTSSTSQSKDKIATTATKEGVSSVSKKAELKKKPEPKKKPKQKKEKSEKIGFFAKLFGKKDKKKSTGKVLKDIKENKYVPADKASKDGKSSVSRSSSTSKDPTPASSKDRSSPVSKATKDVSKTSSKDAKEKTTDKVKKATTSTKKEASSASKKLKEKKVVAATSPVKKGKNEKDGKEKKKKRKLAWIFLLIFAVLVIGAGIYLGLNYDKYFGGENQYAHTEGKVDADAIEATESKEGTSSVSETSSAPGDASSKDGTSSVSEDATEGATETTEGQTGDEENSIDTEATTTSSKENSTDETASSPVVSSNGLSVQKDAPIQVIAGSFTVESNAHGKVEELKAQGFDAAVIGTSGDYHLVSVGSFNSMQELNANKSKIDAVTSTYYVFRK